MEIFCGGMNDNPTTDYIVEISNLRALSIEKDIKIEALIEFEKQYEEQVRALLQERDSRIQELESKLAEVRAVSISPRSPEYDLMTALLQREAEVQTLEQRVQEILSERELNDNRVRESVSESLVEYENRVEELRRDLFSKECDIIRLQEKVDHSLFTKNPEIDTLRARVRELEAMQYPTPAPREVKTLNSVILSLDMHEQPKPILSMVGHIVSLSPRHSPAQPDDDLVKLRNTLEDNISRSAQLLSSLSDSKLDRLLSAIDTHPSQSLGFPKLCLDQAEEFKRLAERYRSEANRYRQLSDSIDVPQKMRLLYEEIRALLSEISLSHQEREQLSLLRMVEHKEVVPVDSAPRPILVAVPTFITAFIESVADEEKARYKEDLTRVTEQLSFKESSIRGLKEQVVAANVELQKKKELLEASTAENLDLHKNVMELTRQVASAEVLRKDAIQTRDELVSKKEQIKTIKRRFEELKRELADTQSARESEMSNLRKECEEVEALRSQVLKLQGDLDLRDKLLKKGQRLPKATVHGRSEARSMSIVKCDAVRVIGLVQSGLTSSRNDGSKEELRIQLYSTQDELVKLRRKYEIEEKFALEMEKLKSVSLENENVRLKAKVDDLEYQFGRLVRMGNATEDTEILRLRVALDCKEAEVQKAQKEKLDLGVEMLQEKNKVLEVDFDRAVMEMRIERLEYALSQKHSVSLGTSASTRESSPIPSSSDSGRLRQELTELRGKLSVLEKVNSDLKNQRDQDKVALEEAERVLSLVQATEKKYVKVAKENAKLRKDLASLDDDNFWNDLDVLQEQYKQSVSILQEVRRDGKYINNRPALAQEIDKIIG